MIVLDAATGWLLGGAALAVVLVGWRLRTRRQRRAAWDRHSSLSPEAVVERDGREVFVPAPPVDSASANPATPASPAPASAATARGQDAIRAELAAHAERLAAARAARAAATAHAAAAAARGAERLQDAAPAEPAVFDPTRTTPWQQVVESVARARAGLPGSAGGTEALRAAVAAAPAVVPSATRAEAPPASASRTAVPRPASVRPGDFAVRTAVPRVPPLDPNELGARPRRVLVADDARVVRVKLHRLLAAQGWEVIEAEDGEAALRLLASRGPDLLITDVDMPGLDGFALTRAVRAQAATAQLPVVMITAADDEHRDEAVSAGVTVLLGKPYGEAALLAHLRRLMGLHPVATPEAVAA